MDNLKPLSLDDFRAMVDNMINDDEGELKLLLAEGRHYQNETAKFDMDFARKMGLVVASIEDLVSYAKTRREII